MRSRLAGRRTRGRLLRRSKGGYRRQSRLAEHPPPHLRRLGFEPLEDRRLLCGVTLITHGFNSDVDGWVAAMAEAISARPDLDIDQPCYVVEVTDPDPEGGPLSVLNTSHTGPSPTSPTTDCPEIVILLDWSDVAGTLPLGGYVRSTTDVALAVCDALLTPGFLADLPTPVAELPLHLIGHSRGASLVDRLAHDLGERGVWVDQVTTLDPHPVDGVREPYLPTQPDWDDAAMTGWENVVFWDNYWRTAGDHSFDFTGEPIANTHDVELVESVLTGEGYSFEHSDVHLWYHGTIDTSTDPPANDGDYDVPDDWYGGPHPSRTGSGYYYSRLVGGTRPADGLSQDVGGEADRADIDFGSAVWPNVVGLAINSDDFQLTAGEVIPVTYYYQDVDGSATVTFCLDADRSPYNANAIETDQRIVAQTGSVLVGDGQDMDTIAVPPGTYYVCTRISDAQGHTRYAYAREELTIDAAPAEVAGHYVFYNNSAWDDPLEGRDDDDAIAVDKMALLPPGTADFDNYTSYSRGINGLMVDIAGLPTVQGPIDPADYLQFKAGNDDTPAGWAPYTATPTVTVRPGEGTGASDRLTLTWPDYDPLDPDNTAVAGQWLEVIVLANDHTGLGEPYVFYFGNAVAETGDSDTDARVDANDVLQTRNNPHPFFNPATIACAYDFNRDQRVDAHDLLMARNNQTTYFDDLELISPPLPAGAKSLGTAQDPPPPVALAESGKQAARINHVGAYDAVLEQVAGQHSSSSNTPPTRLHWLYEFEPISRQQRPAKENESAENVVDRLLRACWSQDS